MSDSKDKSSLSRIFVVLDALFVIVGGINLAQGKWDMVWAIALLVIPISIFFFAFDRHKQPKADATNDPSEPRLEAAGVHQEVKKDAVEVQPQIKKDSAAVEEAFQRKQWTTAAVMGIAVVALILLLALNATHDYVVHSIFGTPTAPATVVAQAATAQDTATPTATVTVTPSATATFTSVPTQTFTPSPVPCFCQGASDDLTIRCLIESEAEAANTGGQAGLDIIEKIFSPSVTIFQGDKNSTWYSAMAYYQPSFTQLTFGNVEHLNVEQRKLNDNRAFYVSGSKGSYQDASGVGGTFNNSSPSEHWVFTKNANGCWAVTYYAFNASHITPFPPAGE